MYFQQIQTKHDKHFYSFLLARHFLHTNIVLSPGLPVLTPVDNILLKFMNSKKCMSSFYSVIV